VTAITSGPSATWKNLVSLTMPTENPPISKSMPALYELRPLRRALGRLEDTHATTSPAIASLKRIVMTRIWELETQLGSTELIDSLTIIRNT